MGVATGGASRGRAPPFCLSGGAGPPNFLRVLIITAPVRERETYTHGALKDWHEPQLSAGQQTTEADLEPTEIRVGFSDFELQFSDWLIDPIDFEFLIWTPINS